MVQTLAQKVLAVVAVPVIPAWALLAGVHEVGKRACSIPLAVVEQACTAGLCGFLSFKCLSIATRCSPSGTLDRPGATRPICAREGAWRADDTWLCPRVGLCNRLEAGIFHGQLYAAQNLVAL